MCGVCVFVVLTLVLWRRVLLQSAEPVDPKPILEKECHNPCVGFWTEYQACGERIKGKAEATCEPQYFDYWKCVDKCVRCAVGSGSPAATVSGVDVSCAVLLLDRSPRPCFPS